MKIVVPVGKINDMTELNPFQLEVLSYICKGLGTKEISEEMKTPYDNIMRIRSKLMDILNARNNVELVYAALHNEIIDLDFE